MSLTSTLDQIKKFETSKSSKRLGQMYRVDLLFRELYKVPSYIPLTRIAHINHGVPIYFKFLAERLSKLKPHDLHFVHTRWQKAFLKNDFNIESIHIGDVFVNYKNLKGWAQHDGANGTIAFPCHSTNYLSSNFDVDKYARQLKELPSIYHPIKICMYWKDLLLNRHLPFVKHGFRVLSAGHSKDPQFCHNLYRILTHSKYVTSNEIGSYTFYALDLKIPFFMYGESVKFEVTNNELTPRNDPEFILSVNQLSKLFKLPSLDVEPAITEEQLSLITHYIEHRTENIEKEVKSTLYKNSMTIMAKKILGSLNSKQ